MAWRLDTVLSVAASAGAKFDAVIWARGEADSILSGLLLLAEQRCL